MRQDALEELSLDGLAPRIGIGIAAQLDRSGERVQNAPNIGWRDVPLAVDLATVLGQRAELINDVDAILLGEREFGGARSESDVLAVFVGTGVGGAILAGGRLIRGAGGTAGEIGHVKLRGSDQLCGCGERGCVEALAGGASLNRRLLADGKGPTIIEVDADYAAGDPYARQLWEEVAEGLGIVISGGATLLNPGAIMLGGGVFDRAPNLLGLVRDRSERLTLAASRSVLRFVRPELGDMAGCLGAAMRAYDR
jgi:glucokinase